MKSGPGTIVSHYKILSEIGKGGMGEVYLAQDTKLNRKAAIKFLNEEFSRDAEKLNRFIQEAQATSALNHPNILTVYGIDSYENTHYIATEFIEGETLREAISRKDTIPLNRILKIAIQTAEALSAAHRAGIAHRDIKPENIMVREDGYVKVLDFGLAKLVEKQKRDGDISLEGETKALVETTPGLVMGTVSYMSPEQARGRKTDERTDIWSLGVVLYELLKGKVPFTGETVNHTIVAILETEPQLLENVPDELRRIVRKTLTKDKENRYQTARDLLIDLKNLRRELDLQGELERSIAPNNYTETAVENQTAAISSTSIEETVPGQGPATQDVTTTSSLEYAVIQAKSHKLLFAVFGLIFIGAISAAGYFAFFSGGSEAIDSIAVMPFVNQSGSADVEYLSDGMTETLISSLSQLPNLKVKGRSAVFRYKGKDPGAKALGNELGVEAVLYGRVSQRGDKLMLSLELLDAVTEDVIWSGIYDRKQEDVVSLQSEIARDISNKLKTKLSGADVAKVEKGYTTNPEAYRLFLQGRYYWNKRNAADLKKSIGFFNQAIALDPAYALAYAGLADTYVVLSGVSSVPPKDTFPKARGAAEKALELDSGLAGPRATLASVLHNYDWKHEEAEKEFKRAIELDPDYPSAHQWYGQFLSQMGNFEEAIAELERAFELDPYSPIISSNLGSAYRDARRFDDAIKQFEKTIEIEPGFEVAGIHLYQTLLAAGKYNEVIEGAVVRGDITEKFAEELRTAFRKSGKRGYWQKILELSEESARANNREIGLYDLAQIQLGIGNKDKAIDSLEKLVADGRGEFGVITLRSDIRWEGLRDEPRFKALLRKVGLPES